MKRVVKGFKQSYISLLSNLSYCFAPIQKLQKTPLIAFVHSYYIIKESICIKDLDFHNFHNDFKPCLCSCYFNHLAHIMLHIHHYIPRCPYYTTYFAFRRTGVHPPSISFL